MAAEVRMKRRIQAIARKLYPIVSLVAIAFLMKNLCLVSPAKILENQGLSAE